MKKFPLVYLTAFAVTALGLSPSAFAANAVWNVDALGDWATGSNWNPAAAPGLNDGSTTSTDVATFGNVITATRVITVDTNRNISGITFNANSFAYQLTGGSLLLTSGGTIQTSGAGTAHTDSIASQMIIQGNGGSYTIATNSSTAARVLNISGGITGVSTLGNTTTLTIGGGGNSSSNTLSGVIGDGSGGGKLAVSKTGSGFWILSGVNTFSGGFTLSAGNIKLTNSASLGAGTVTIGGGSFSSSGGGITFNNNMVWNGNVTFDNANGNSGNLTMGTSSGSNTVLLTGNRTVNTTASAATLTVNSVIGDGGGNFGITKGGAYTLVLNGANTYTGTTNVGAGTVVLGASGNLASASILSVNEGAAAGAAGGRFHLNGRNQTVAGLTSTATGSGAKGVIANNGTTNSTLTVDSAGNSTFDGVLIETGTAGTLALAKAGAGTLTLTGSHNYAGGTTVTDGTLVVNGGVTTGLAASSTQGVIAGSANGVFLMTGLDAGVVSGLVVGQRITGTNIPANAYITSIASATSVTYSTFVTSGNTSVQPENFIAYSGSGLGSGNVTVSGGKLVAGNAGALAGGGTILINGGRLSSSVANATVGGDLGMSSGSLDANDTGVGSFTLAADKDFSLSGGTWNLTLGSGSGVINGSDQVLGSGTGSVFTLANATIALDLGGGFSYLNSYDILNGFNSGSVSGLAITGYDSVGYIASVSNTGVLTFTAVPEPSTYALLGTGISALWFLRRKKRA